MFSDRFFFSLMHKQEFESSNPNKWIIIITTKESKINMELFERLLMASQATANFLTMDIESVFSQDYKKKLYKEPLLGFLIIQCIM